jgi:hypothetical protein
LSAILLVLSAMASCARRIEIEAQPIPMSMGRIRSAQRFSGRMPTMACRLDVEADDISLSLLSLRGLFKSSCGLTLVFDLVYSPPAKDVFKLRPTNSILCGSGYLCPRNFVRKRLTHRPTLERSQASALFILRQPARTNVVSRDTALGTVLDSGRPPIFSDSGSTTFSFLFGPPRAKVEMAITTFPRFLSNVRLVSRGRRYR